MVQEFMERLDHAQIATGVKLEINLAALRGKYGNDFNVLSIINTDASDAIEIYLDGVKVKYVTANNGVFSFDQEFGLIYNFLSIENIGAGTIEANLVKISVGRAGKD